MPEITTIISKHQHASFQAELHARLHNPIADEGSEQHKWIKNTIRRGVFRTLGNNHDRAAHNERVDGRNIRRIAIFRYDALGDYVITTGLIRWLRSALPQARIDVIASHRNTMLASADPFVDRSYILHDRHTLLHRSFFDLLRTIGPRDYDMVFALPTNRMTRCALLARILAPKAEKISLLHRPRKGIYGEVFHRQLDRPSALEHWSETFLRMATETIVPAAVPFARECRPYLVLDEAGWRGAEAFMRAQGLRFEGLGPDVIPGRGWRGSDPVPFQGDPYCVVNISAHCSERQWSPEQCAAACRELIRLRPGLRLYITGAPADTADVRSVVQKVGYRHCRELSMRLAQFIAFVAGASLVISPDTATVHIAAAAGRPVVGLYAEEIKAAEWYPYTERFILLVSPSEESIDFIEPEAVADAACRLLEERREFTIDDLRFAIGKEEGAALY